jgi:hypothetical protein
MAYDEARAAALFTLAPAMNTAPDTLVAFLATNWKTWFAVDGPLRDCETIPSPYSGARRSSSGVAIETETGNRLIPGL